MKFINKIKSIFRITNKKNPIAELVAVEMLNSYNKGYREGGCDMLRSFELGKKAERKRMKKGSIVKKGRENDKSRRSSKRTK